MPPIPFACTGGTLSSASINPIRALLVSRTLSYFAVGVLEGEVFNGGFDQFFFNSSGPQYEDARRGLEELGAVASLALLDGAKELLFPSVVPTDIGARRAILRASGGAVSAQLDVLDAQFWKDPDGLGARLQRFALERGLVDVSNRPTMR